MDRLDAQLFEGPTVHSHFSLFSSTKTYFLSWFYYRRSIFSSSYLLWQKVVDKSFSSSTLCSLCKYTIVLCFIITDDNPPSTLAYKIILLVIAIIIVLAICCLTNGRVDLCCCVELIAECISDWTFNQHPFFCLSLEWRKQAYDIIRIFVLTKNSENVTWSELVVKMFVFTYFNKFITVNSLSNCIVLYVILHTFVL